MALSPDEITTFNRLHTRMSSMWGYDERYGRYYEGLQRLDHIGLAVPPELRRFETIVNWPRLAIDSLENRLDIRSLAVPDDRAATAMLREGWAANNLDSESSLAHLDALIYGRSFVCVGSNPENRELPLVTVESPREVAADVNPVTRRISAALRIYGGTPENRMPGYATLYLPNETIWLAFENGVWLEFDRDQHNLGRVPMIMMLNRRRTGDWYGVSEMADVIPLTDAAARALTDMQLAMETHAVPRRYALGLTKGDFVDAQGVVLPAWEAYYGAIWASQNKDAKFGQFDATDLKNFHETVNLLALQVAAVTGLPLRYMGQFTHNPPSADGIRADETTLVKRAERKQEPWGSGWGWIGAIYLRFKTGQWVDGNRVSTSWFDAATPTYAARVDGIQKSTGGKAWLSVEGAWDEMGWSEDRKDIERARLKAEATDPALAAPVPVQTSPIVPKP